MMKKNVVSLVIELSVTIITIGLITTISSLADAQEATPILADITIDKEFKPDPLIVRGMSGASILASEVNGGSKTQTGDCSGFVDKDANHNLTLKSKFDYLKIQVESPADTTMMIKGAGGTWCNDDLNSKNPGIVGEWLKGNYKIWVGSSQQGKSVPYILKITKN